MSGDARTSWIREELVPRLLAVCPEFRNAKLRQCDVTEMEGNKDNWASTLFSVKMLIFRDADESRDLIVKLMLSNETIRDLFKSYEMFYNEKYFYTEILACFDSVAAGHESLLPSSWFPKHYYSSVIRNEGIVVLEDLRQTGFRLGGRSSLDETECRLAMNRLGRFHALSYYFKIKDPSTFRKIVSGILDADMMTDVPEDPPTFRACCQRIMDVLEKENYEFDSQNGDAFKKYRNIINSPLKRVLEELLKPKEPLAVICHGDFCRNNMMFRYEHEAVDVKFLDLQKPMYCSPAVDLAFFIFMCAPEELRDCRWSELLSWYHEPLWDTMTKLLGRTPDVEFGREAFESDLSRHAMHGYLYTVFFLPWMMVPPEELEEVNELGSDPWSEEFAAKCASLGGQEATERLVKLTKHLLTHDLVQLYS